MVVGPGHPATATVVDRRGRRWAAVVGLVAVVILGGFGVSIAVASERNDAEHRHRQLATVAAAAMSDTLAGAATALSGVNGIAADGVVDANEFQAFAVDVVAASALMSLADVLIVAHRDRPTFERLLGRPITERTAAGGFVPAGRRDTYAAVVDVSPVTTTTSAVLGFDILSDPVRSRAAETAAMTRDFVLSDPVPLAPSGRLGYFVIQPVFAGNGDLIGYVSTGLLADDIVDAARDRLPPGTSVGLREAGLVVAEARAGAISVTVEAAGRQWTVSADDGEPTDWSTVVVVAVATVLLAVLLGLLAVREARFDRTRLAFAARLTEESRRTERLAEVGRRLSVARHLDGVVAVIEHDVPRVFEADVADVGLLLDNNSLSMLAPHRRVSLDTRHPTPEAVRENRLVLVPDLRAYAADLGSTGLMSAAAVPLVDENGRAFAVIGLAWRQRQEFPPTVAALLRTVGDMCGQSLDRARDADRQHAFVSALQRRLLPVPPVTLGLDIVARYRSATATMGMGGDWYQFLAMPDGSMVIVVGDVIGHGVDAIAVMTQIQSVTAAVVQMGVPLAEVFSHVDMALGPPLRGAHASALILHVDRAAGRVRYISAGHPYGLLRAPNGVVTKLASAQHGLVGLPPAERSAEAYAEFPPGSLLLAYTDGLIERRNRPITTGIDLLAADLSRLSGDDLDRLVEELIEDALVDRGDGSSVDDDVAVVLIRSRPE